MQEALVSLVDTGELREELLPFLWRNLELGQHQEQILQMLRRSGIFFASTGVIERAVASLEDVGTLRFYWQTGALVIALTSSGSEQRVLLQSLQTPTRPQLRVEVRGEAVEQLRVLLGWLCCKVDVILSDFCGLIGSEWRLACPRCLSEGRLDEPQTWRFVDASGPKLCQKCIASVVLPTAEREMLILICSPTIKPLADALPEAREVAREVAATCQGMVEVRNGGTADALRQQLLAVPTRTFLFSGHANATNTSGYGFTLGFTKDGGGLELVDNSVVAGMLGRASVVHGGLLELVFLNGCCSEGLGQAVRAAGVATVVCWRTQVEDHAARIFSKAFFEARRAGRGIAHAFEDAKAAVLTVTQPGQSDGLSTDVPVYEIREQGTPTRSVTTPAPVAAGIPVLLM